jgi:hypothetical protein
MFYLTIIGAVFLVWLTVVTCSRRRSLPSRNAHQPDDDHFINVLEANCQARLLPGNRSRS